MESWVLEGDSYSFLRSAPRNFNLQHLDGPNRVEIFDITSIPSHRSAISETTCLCDIFGDDCESPSLSSSPASASFLKKDVDEQLPVEDVNDSSGSYHTANGSEHLSDGSDTFEDSKDTKDLILSDTGESKTPASDLTLPNDKSEVTSVNGSPKPTGNWQESLSQDTSLVQDENLSDQQQVTSTSEFRDTNIRVTGSSQEIISPDLLSENKGIRDQSHATSSSTEEIITPDLRSITKQRDAFSSEQKENHSTQKIITPEFSPENGGLTEQTTTSEVRETDSTHYKQRESTFSENQDSAESFSNLASEDSPKENNALGCSGEEEEKISLPDILPKENISFVRETVKSDPSVALTNFSNDGSDFTPVQKTASDPYAKDGTHDLREMSAPLEHEVVPNKSSCIGTFQAGPSDLEDPNTVPPPTYVEDNTEIDVASMPQHFNISSETRETVILHEHRTLSSFSDTTEGLIPCVISELCSPSGSSVDVNSSEPPIIINSPVGFTICPSPEPENNIWSAGPEDLAFTHESPESDFRLTPTDNFSVSSFDSNLFPTPEPRSITSTPENRQNVFICELSPAASSLELRSASCSPECKIMTCSSLKQHSKSPQIEKKVPQNDFSSQNEILAQTHDAEGIIHAESFMSTTLPTKEVADVTIPTTYNLSSAQGGISSPSTTLPRDTMSPDKKGTRSTESPTSDILPTNMAIFSNLSSTDRCIISPHSTISIPRGTESPDVHEIRSVESSISPVPPINETMVMAISPVSNLSSTEGGISRSPSTLCIPRDTASPDVVGTRSTESSTSTTLPRKDIENVVSSPILQPSSKERVISRPPSNLSAPSDTASPDVDGIRCVKSPASTTILTNEITIMAISPLPNHSPTASHLSIPRNTVSPDVEGIRYAQSSISTMLPIQEIENVVVTPITHLSSTEGGISRSASTLSIPRDTMSPDVVETSCVERSVSTIPPTNETTNMAISPISNCSSTEGGISRPSSTLSIPRNTVSPDIDGIRCMEIPTSTTVLTNEMTNMANSSINLSLTGGISRPPSNLSIPGDTICLDVEETKYIEQSNEIPTNETTKMAISPISNHSTTEGGISRPPSTSGISRHTASTDVHGLRCIESPTSTILPTNEAPNMGISPVFNISPTEGGLSNPLSTLSIPGVTMSPDVVRIPTNDITNMANSFSSNLSSTEGGISRPSSTLSIPRDTMSPDVEGTRYAERSNEIPTNENKNMALSISNLTTPSNILTDIVSSPKVRHQRSADRLNDNIPAPEMSIPLKYTDNHLSTTVSEKVDLPLMVPFDVGQIDDTGYKMPIKSCSLPQNDCTDIASVPCSQTDKISDSSPEPPTPKLSVKQIKESWERMNESILNSLNPWQTSKKILTVPAAKEAKEGNDSGREMLERESAGSEKTFGQMAMRPGESPSVLHSNNHSMYEGQSCRNKGWSGERVIQEEHTLGKGVGNIAEDSYRGEQVELSFSTRNRKGPAIHSPAPSSRDPKSGIPPRYFESPLATRRQQRLFRAQNLQKENKTGARRIRSTSQSNYSGAGRLSSECTSDTSSMGSEFDDADSEVKWFTDQAFRSLSSPQVDYLDVYNSSRGSSANVSQPSTVNSPGSATWISYADLHDSLHENDDVLCHTSSFIPHGTLDPAKRFEMGSFECVDVEVESKEETRRGKRTVPKRQIQFKRRNFDELKSTENEGKAMDSLSIQTCSRDTFVRQHSTPASMQEDLVQGEHEIQSGKKVLQKSASLDESSHKSKMACSVIKSVLSKKMDTATKESSKSEPCENKKKHIDILSAGESSNAERQSSSLPSECGLSSEDFADKEERTPHPQKRSCRPKVPPKPVFKANCFPPNNNPAGVAFQGKTLVKDQIRPIMVDAFESKISKKQTFRNSEKEASKVGDEYSSDSGSAINWTPNCTAICVASTRSRMTNSDNKHPMTPETHKQQEGSSSMFLSKTPEITLKPCTIKDKNKSSLKTSLCPELEISKDTICEPQLEEKLEEQMRFKTEVEADTEEDNEQNKAKSVIHKVRDVRKLVKNTYNLSFKASNTTQNVEDIVPEKKKEMKPEYPHPLHIECRAISWKDKTASCNKSTTQQDVAHTGDKSKMPQTDSPVKNDVGITKITTKASLPNIQHSDVDLSVGLDKCNNISKSSNCEQSTKLEMPSRPPSKEISTLVFLQDGTPKSMQKPTSPASPDVKTANSSHSVSMLRKEKGMQADIGVCDVLSEGVDAKPKHINRLEVPLQTYASEGTSSEFQKVKKEDADFPPEQKTSLNSGLQTSEGSLQVRSSPKPMEVRVLPSGKGGDNQSQGDLLQPPKEQEITVAASSKAEVRAFSSNTKIHAMPVTTSKEIELPIQVRSISSDRPKPSVLPKPSFKQPFAEIRSTSTDFPKTDITPTTSILKEQTHIKSDVKIIETSATVIHNEQSTNTASSNTKTLAVSAVSSHKPQTIPVTTMSSSAQKSTATTGRPEVSFTSMPNSSNRQQQNIQEQMIPATSYASDHQTLPVISQANTYMQPTMTTSSNNQLHTDDFHFPTSDDPPSYDERESFSPLQLSDLPPRRPNRYHPTTKHSLCSCTSCTHPQFGQPYHGSQNQTPPAPRSPGQVISYPGAPPQAQVRPHQCRPDVQPSNYPSVSPKTTVQQAPAMIQPMHHSHTCPAPAIQPYGNEQQQPSTQHMDRRSGNQRSPQAPGGAAYQEHSRSPNIAALDPRSQFFNPQELPPAFGHEYGSDGPGGGGVLYPENASGLGFGQGPRRVLLDPETGKYFYIEVPMQPLRKMLFDPEIGQYVEVLIPQQAMSNSSMYPPTTAPYQGPYHGQGLYASQYLPYAMPPHPQSAQQPRHPEPSVPTSLHQTTMGYGSSASQAPKSDVKGHPSLDQSYLESMYYIPTGMNASPNSTPSDCYHKPATNMPAAGGRRA
ncbi:uncharacterized protein si:ch73-43g23.1 [Pangasianodon hypophthalmus]|uniref:uncharacterized protein si:ch73-43g23.1 n=1 Tax=Pangasianodon hypophthalmus TaxID=310915 RepID=UPI0023080B33|nr:uncharacterized protein si:ch73-43g23.1 [Pangasianodon hypophthalmus]XP_053091349.1 uncharacterized protein si:ch73-43g23.1 [Pangasianodon hypophthalmus]